LTVTSGASRAPASAASHPSAASPSAQTLARIVFALLVLASFAAFAITQRLKHIPTTLQGTALLVSPFSPTPQGHIKVDRLHFHINHSDDVTVIVVDAHGHTVRTLAYRHHLLAYRRLRLGWDGLTSAGTPAPAGTYRVEVELLHEKRKIPFPSSIQLIIPAPANSK
jgi:hypothetical protein